MGFKELPQLNAEKTYALGGTDKKTRKPNPKQVEGYYLGSREIASPKSKTGLAKIHFFQTRTGNHGIWGKTNMDQQLNNNLVGTMLRVTFTGMVPTKNNPMYVYKVEVDADNTIDVSSLEANNEAEMTNEEATNEEFNEEEPEEESFGEEEAPMDEVPPVAAARPKATPPSAASRAKVEALLGKRKSAAA